MGNLIDCLGKLGKAFENKQVGATLPKGLVRQIKREHKAALEDLKTSGEHSPKAEKAMERAILDRHQGEIRKQLAELEKPVEQPAAVEPPPAAPKPVSPLENVSAEQSSAVVAAAKVVKDTPGVTQAVADHARGLILEGFGPGAAHAGEFVRLRAENARELGTIGAAHLMEGRTGKAEWADAMRQEYGVSDAMPAELNKIWQDSHAFVRDFQAQKTGRAASPKAKIEGEVGLRPRFQLDRSVSGLRKQLRGMVTRSAALAEYFKGQEKGAQAGRRAMTDEVRIADKWLQADANAVRRQLLDFSKNLPLHERAKFLPAITSALERASILSKDQGGIYRRAEHVLNRMTAAVYDFNRKTTIQRTEKLLKKVEDARNMTVPEKEAIRQRGKTFSQLKNRMSLDMLQAMHEQMRVIKETGKEMFLLDETISNLKVKAAIKEIADQGTRRIDIREQIQPALGENQKYWEGVVENARSGMAEFKETNLGMQQIDWMFMLFDQKEGGALYRLLKLEIDMANGNYLDAYRPIREQLGKVVRENNLTDGNLKRIQAHAELRQEGGLENLRGRYSEAEINSARTLTKPELNYLRASDALNKELLPKIKDVLAKAFHQEIVEVDGYFPRIRDWEHYNTLSIEEGRFAESMNRSSTKMGAAIERTGAVTKNITNAHDIMTKHTGDALHHVHLGPAVAHVAKIIKDPSFVELVGTEGQRLFADWLDAVSRNGGVGGGRRSRVADVIRSNVGVGNLAFRATTIGSQVFSILNGMAVVSPKNITLALDGALSPARRQYILKNFPEIRESVGFDPAMADYGGKSFRDKAARTGFAPTSFLDNFARIVVAEGAYRDVLASQGKKFDINLPIDKAAMWEATRRMRQTQSSAFTKDVPLVLSHGRGLLGNASANRAVLQFQNFIMNRYDLVKRLGLQIGVKEKNPRQAARVLTFVIIGSVAEQLARDGILRATRAMFGSSKQEDKRMEKQDQENYARRISEKAAVDLATSMPIVTNFAGMIRYKSSGIPVVDTAGDVAQGVGQLFGGKKPETKVAGAIGVVKGVGAATGLPTGQFGELAERIARDRFKKESAGEQPVFY